MPLFKDAEDRYVYLRSDHVSGIAPGGNGAAIVYLRGGQQLAVHGQVEGIWRVLLKEQSTVPDLDKQAAPDPAAVQTIGAEASPDMDSGGAG